MTKKGISKKYIDSLRYTSRSEDKRTCPSSRLDFKSLSFCSGPR